MRYWQTVVMVGVEMKRLFVLLMVLLIAAAPKLPKRVHKDGELLEPTVLTYAERVLLEEDVKAQLRDPESARFKFPPALPETGAYCFTVSAKNMFGGYGDPVLIAAVMVVVKNGQLWLTNAKLPQTDTEKEVTRYLCVKGGYLPRSQ